LDVLFGSSTNVSLGGLHYFNTALTVVGDDVPSDVGLAVRAEHDHSVEGALLDLVAPHQGHGSRTIIHPDDLNAVLVRLEDLVVEYFGLVVLDLDADPADLDFILDDVRVDVESGDDRRAATEPNLVSLDLRAGGYTLDEDASGMACHEDVLTNDDVVLRLHVDHDASRREVGEGTLVDGDVALQREDASGHRIVQGISLEIAVEYFNGAIRHGHDARDFLVSFPRAPVEREDAVVHFEDAALDHDYAVHVVAHVELLDAVLTAVLVEHDRFLVGLHVKFLVRTGQNHFQIIYRASLLGTDVNYKARPALLTQGNVEGLLDRLEHEAGLLHHH